MVTNRWKLLSGDASGIPCTYVRKVDSSTYDVCETNMWEDLDSSAVATHGRYNVQSGTVDLTSSEVPSALRCCGFMIEAHTGNIVNEHDRAIVAEHGSPAYSLVIVECLWSYGAKDVACDVSGNNLRALTRKARNAV